jgi:hypothetical protein
VKKEAASLFQQAGEAFNDATTRLIGGVDATNQAAVTKDLQTTQSLVNQVLSQDAAALNADATIHAHEVSDQINLELTYIAQHLDPYAPKGINDIQRDIIDIVQGDPLLAKLAGDGFSPLPPLATGPAPYVLNDAQAAFLTQFDHDVTALGNESVALVKAGGDVTAEVAKLDAFAAFADQFSASQGGLYSARFDNELRLNGNNGTIVHQLEAGLQNHDAKLVTQAANDLVANANDLSGNQVLADGTHVTAAAITQTGTAKNTPTTDTGHPDNAHQDAKLTTPKTDTHQENNDQHTLDALHDLMQTVAEKVQPPNQTPAPAPADHLADLHPVDQHALDHMNTHAAGHFDFIL